MTCNFSRGSICSTYRSPEQSLSSSIRCSNGYVLDNYADKNSDGIFDWTSSRSRDWDLEKTHHNTGKTELGGHCEPMNDDVRVQLPADPFGMDGRSTLMAITGCLQGFEKGFESGSGGCGVDEAEEKIGDGALFAGLNWVWNNARRFDRGLSDVKFDELSLPYNQFNGFGFDSELFYDGYILDGNMEEFLGLSHVENWVVNDGAQGVQDCSTMDSQEEGSAPNEAMFFVLGYLGIQDLLSVEKVCTSLRDAVRTDSLLWRSVLIDWPLNERITDDSLVKLTSRAQGTLQSLCLFQCMRITDGGLKRVLVSNPRLTKLSVPGCVRVSVEGILFNLQAIKSAGIPGIKHLRIGGISGVTDKQFEELKSLLDADNQVKQLITNKPRFYNGRQSYLLCDDDRPIDVEVCPRCQKLRVVYDCPAEGCQEKQNATQLCRACTLCIARCFHCGRCIKDCDYEETFCLDMLCLDCWKHLLNCQERQVVSSKCTIFHQEARYQVCFFG